MLVSDSSKHLYKSSFIFSNKPLILVVYSTNIYLPLGVIKYASGVPKVVFLVPAFPPNETMS